MKDLLFLDQSQPDTPVESVRNDIVLDGRDFAVVEGAPRKVQDITKILITEQQSNSVYPGYGTVLPGLIGERNVPGLEERVKESVMEAMAFIQEVETSPKKDERVRRIVSLTLDTTADPRAISLNLVVELENGELARNNFTV